MVLFRQILNPLLSPLTKGGLRACVRSSSPYEEEVSRGYSRGRNRLFLDPLRGVRCNQRGFSLIETVVSIGVLGTVAIALVGAMATGALGHRVVGKDMTAARLAVTQMDNTKSYTPYLAPPASYPTITPPNGYGITAAATAIPDRNSSTLEKITVTVTYDGSIVKVLEDYKANR